jgi:hypothetical protein
MTSAPTSEHGGPLIGGRYEVLVVLGPILAVAVGGPIADGTGIAVGLVATVATYDDDPPAQLRSHGPWLTPVRWTDIDVSELKTAAEIWRRRLRDGLVSPDDVKEWADEVIAEIEDPDMWLIDVSMAPSKVELNEALERAPGEADARAVFSGIITPLKDLLARRPDLDSEIARALFHMHAQGDVPVNEALGEMAGFWDDIDLARDGIYGDREEARHRLEEFLEYWSRSR